MKSLKFISALFFSWAISFGYSQISVTGGLTAQQLAQILCGSNISVTNATITGPAAGYGSFTVGSGFPFSSGVILTNGLLSQTPGPNNDPNSSSNLGGVGTTEMTTLGGANSYDVVTLEFDFVVQSSAIQFQYIFASEEYPEFAPPNQPSFNDVFAFYISGPGITGQQNIALIPGTTSPVSIDNVNPVTYPQYYVDNTNGQAIQFDGYTTNLTAVKTGLIPCQTYHLRMVIADIQTANRNSAVFLKENSFVQENVLGAETQTIDADGIALEGCVKGSFAFNFAEVSNQDRTITFSIGGSAVNGVDYSYIDNSITIPAGETSGTVYIDAFSDGLTEGPETISIIYNSGICGGTDTVLLTINDAQPINFTLNGTNLDCFGDNGGEILVNATGGFPGYTYYVTNPSGNTSIYNTNPITGLAAGEYSVQVHDTYGCKAEALVIGGQFNAGTTFLPDGNGVTYQAPLTITGFNPGQTITNVNQIQQICLTMEHSFLGDLWIRVQSPSGQSITLKEQNGGASCDLGEPIATGPVDGTGSSDTTPGTGYEYCFNANPIHSTMVNESGAYQRNYTDGVGNSYIDTYLPAGSYTAFDNFSGLLGSQMNGTWKVYVTDQYGLDNGYIFNWYISLIGDLPDTTVVLTQPQQLTVSGLSSNATCGFSNGAINISALNGVGPLTYIWSNGASTEDLTNVAAGQYTVTVTDANGCSATETFSVNNSGTLFASGNVSNASCYGGANGTINITPSGGMEPYSYSWSNGANTEDVSGLPAGNYTVTITDNTGCQFLNSFTIGQASQITINPVAVVNENCNTDNGSIDVAVSGGNGSYGYSWSNGAITQDISNLTSGAYLVTVTDGIGCTTSSSFQIANNLTGCSNFCYLNISANQITPSTCGTANGSINVNILNAQSPFTINWSNSQNTEDISGLLPGNYSITVTDAGNCTSTATFNVINQTNGLAIASSSIQDEICGFDNGSIDISIQGGVSPYSYSWSNGATTQDISGLAAGTYSVTVIDNTGCNFSQSFSIVNNPGSLNVTGSTVSSICSSNNGSITQTISGANGSLSFLWSNGATTQNISGLTTGDYSCTVTDGSGCSTSNTYTVGLNTGNVALTGVLVTNEVCNNNQGAINITASGNGLSYLWSNGSTSEDITGLSSGNYSCIITNAQGCSVNTGIISIINSPGTMVVSNQAVTSSSCGAANGAIDVNVFNGQSPFSYSWSNGAITQDITGLSSGVYTLQITDNNGCSLAHSVSVGSSSGSLVVSLASITHESCISGVGTNGQGAIDITVSGSTAPYSYVWSNGANTQDVSGLTDGVYSVTVNSSEGCSLSQTYMVLANGSNLAVQSTSINDEICGSGTGSIHVTLDPTSAPYNFLWSTGAITEDINNLSSGNYQLTVSNSFGCQVSQSFTVGNSAGSLAISSVVATNENCGNGTGSVNISVTGGNAPLSYQWSNGASTQDIFNLHQGNYSVIVTDIYGCTAQTTQPIQNSTNGLSVQITSIVDETCGQSNGSIDITASSSGTLTFLWSNGSTTEDIDNLHAGNYSITVTDQTGCQATTSATVANQTGSLAISFNNVQNETCGNGQGFIDIQVSVTGPFSYSWSNNMTTQDIVGLSSGNYTVTITDGTGCQLSQTFNILNVNSSQVSATLNVTNELCSSNNGAIDLIVNAGITPFVYTWSNGLSSQDLSGLASGNYSVVITDGVGCQTTLSTFVNNQSSGLAITSIDNQFDYCNNYQGGFVVNTTGSVLEYYLDGIPYGSPYIFGLGQGIYTITVIDNIGCSVSTIDTIDNIFVVAISETHVDATCGASNGSINLTVGGGTPASYSYYWSNGATTEDLSNIPAGTYTVTVVLDNGPGGSCSDQLTVVVSDDVGFNVASSYTNDYCGQGLGGINQTISNGTGMSYLWSNGATTEDLVGVIYGPYSCTITETGGCTSTFNYYIQNTTSGATVSQLVGNEICGDNSGFIDINVSGGSGSYDYSWSNLETTQDISGLSGGVYTVTITDLSDGCVFGTTLTVQNEVTNFGGSGFVSDATCATCNDGAIYLFLNWSSSYTFNWSNGVTTQDNYNLSPGIYSVIVTSVEGCDTTMTFAINTASIVDVNQSNVSMEVFPNPASDEFSVQITLPYEMSGELVLTDLVGKEIRTIAVSQSGIIKFENIGLLGGVYFVTYNSKKYKEMRRLVISSH